MQLNITQLLKRMIIIPFAATWMNPEIVILSEVSQIKRIYSFSWNRSPWSQAPEMNTYAHSVLFQFSSVTQSCLTLCNPMNCSTPGLPVHHQLLEFIQTHVYRVSDAIQPSHPRSSPSPPAPSPSQHQSLFQ